MIDYSEEKNIDGKQLFDLFKAVGWILPSCEKTHANSNADAIANHTFYLDDDCDGSFLSTAFNRSTYVVSAWDKSVLVGVIRVLSDTIQRSVIYDFAVIPAYQGQGIGKELLERSLQRCGKTQVTLGTSSKNFIFYSRFGFSRSGNYMEKASDLF